MPFFIVLILWLPVFSQKVITPREVIHASGGVTDFVIRGQKVIMATEAGTIETFDIARKSKKVIARLPEIKDFMGDAGPAKVLAVDRLGGRLLAVSIGEHGFRNLLVIENGQMQEVINAGHEKMMISKARWIGDGRVLISLLSNDLILFDIKQKNILKKINISPYTFSDFCLNEQKIIVFSSDESGVIHRTDIKKMAVAGNYTGLNVDKIFQLDYKNGVILTGGKDRRVGVINTLADDQYYLQKEFHIYAVGLDNQGKTGAFTANEENDITVFSIDTKKEHTILKGHRGLVTRIVFYDEKTVISADNAGALIIWKLP